MSYILGAATVTVKGSDGRSIQVPQSVVAQVQFGLVQPGPDGTVTIQGSDGKPVKIPQSSLASAASSMNVTGGNVVINHLLNFVQKCFTKNCRLMATSGWKLWSPFSLLKVNL